MEEMFKELSSHGADYLRSGKKSYFLLIHIKRKFVLNQATRRHDHQRSGELGTFSLIFLSNFVAF